MQFLLLALLAGHAFQGAVATFDEATHIKRQGPTPAGACTTFQTPTIPGVTVVSIQAARRQGVVVNTTLMGDNGPQQVPALDICDVNVTLSHGTSGDRVRVEVCKFCFHHNQLETPRFHHMQIIPLTNRAPVFVLSITDVARR